MESSPLPLRSPLYQRAPGGACALALGASETTNGSANAMRSGRVAVLNLIDGFIRFFFWVLLSTHSFFAGRYTVFEKFLSARNPINHEWTRLRAASARQARMNTN